MPTPAERKALLFLAGLLVLGTGARMERATSRSAPPSDASRAALKHQIERVDSARSAGRSHRRGGRVVVRTSRGATALSSAKKHLALGGGRRIDGGGTTRPPVSGGRGAVDLDRASAAEIERLPGIGPVLARRVVANRDSLGPFGSLKALERVKGIGPATAKRLAPYVTFSLSPRPSGVEKLTRPARVRWIRRRMPGPGSG